MEVEKLPDLSDWRYVEVWTLEEAAMLWAAIDPMAHQGKRLAELSSEIHPTQYRKALVFLRAATEAVCAGTLSFTEAWNEFDDDMNGPWLCKVEFPDLPDASRIVPHMARVQQAAFLKWAQSKQIPSLRQSLVKARKAEPPPGVVDAQGEEPELQQESVLLLAKPSPLDTNHPHHSEEVGLAARVWEMAVDLEPQRRGKSVKAVIENLLETLPEYSHLSGEAFSSRIARAREAVVATGGKTSRNTALTSPWGSGVTKPLAPAVFAAADLIKLEVGARLLRNVEVPAPLPA